MARGELQRRFRKAHASVRLGALVALLGGCGGGVSASAPAPDSGATDGPTRDDGTAQDAAPASDGQASDAPTSQADASPEASAGSDAGSGGTDSAAPPDGSTMAGLHVSGSQLVDNGKVVRLLGVNHSGTEYQCVNGDNAIFEGPSDSSLVMPMKAWNVNTVRLGLNEDCWLGINGVASKVGGMAYQSAITAFVQMLRANGLYVIVELHWNAPGSTLAMSQQPMPDADHATDFWKSVAGAFMGDLGVLFDLYNEPYPDNNQDTTAAWTCWRDGGTCSSVSFPVVGMQSLVTTVRAAGARNVILLGGVQYANALSQWLAYEPMDPLGNLGASTHVYQGQVCASASCYNSTIAKVAAKVPVVTGELGENDCAHAFVDSYFAWADPLGISYLGWAWNAQDCSGFPALIKDYTGTPTAFGQGFMMHLPTQ
jgi:hypothetical protein